MDLINDLEYPVSPSGSLAGAFSDPSIQNTDFDESEEEGQEDNIFRQITMSQVIRANTKELVG
jgi:hypothetical protein